MLTSNMPTNFGSNLEHLRESIHPPFISNAANQNWDSSGSEFNIWDTVPNNSDKNQKEIELESGSQNIKVSDYQVGRVSNSISSSFLYSFQAFDDRIEELKVLAAKEGDSLNQNSLNNFLEFYKRNLLLKYERLVLMENGNLRAVWKGKQGEHIGFQFLQDGFIQFVIFKKRDSNSVVSRIYGRDTVDGIMNLIKAFEIKNIILNN